MRMKPADIRAAMPSKWIDHLANGSHSAASPGGCGEAICNATLLVACNDPPGNYVGRKPY
jgi:hypothetical protein